MSFLLPCLLRVEWPAYGFNLTNFHPGLIVGQNLHVHKQLKNRIDPQYVLNLGKMMTPQKRQRIASCLYSIANIFHLGDLAAVLRTKENAIKTNQISTLLLDWESGQQQ